MRLEEKVIAALAIADVWFLPLDAQSPDLCVGGLSTREEEGITVHSFFVAPSGSNLEVFAYSGAIRNHQLEGPSTTFGTEPGNNVTLSVELPEKHYRMDVRRNPINAGKSFQTVPFQTYVDSWNELRPHSSGFWSVVKPRLDQLAQYITLPPELASLALRREFSVTSTDQSAKALSKDRIAIARGRAVPLVFPVGENLSGECSDGVIQTYRVNDGWVKGSLLPSSSTGGYVVLQSEADARLVDPDLDLSTVQMVPLLMYQAVYDSLAGY